MKTKTFLGLVAILILICFFFRIPTTAQNVQLGAFEYKVLLMDQEVYRKTQEFESFLKSESDFSKANVKFLEYVCSYMGNQGWDLTQIDRPNKGNVFYYYFKRKKP